MALTKRMKAMLAKLPKTDAPLPIAEAVSIIKGMPPTKFDQTVEIHMRLGIDPKQADQIVRGSLVLPHGIGKSKRVVVFAKGDGTPEFKRDATWLSKPRLANDAGKTNRSYESNSHPGEYLRLGRPMERKPVKSDGQKIEATFEEMR